MKKKSSLETERNASVCKVRLDINKDPSESAANLYLNMESAEYKVPVLKQTLQLQSVVE